MKKVALINDLSGFGKCSLTAAIPVISILGLQACPLPTAILSAQTGFPSFFCDDYTAQMNCITNEWSKMGATFDGIASGYLSSAGQMHHVLSFLEQFHTKDTLYLADPVMGDNGQRIRIFTEELLDCMKVLTKKADIITPNLTELCLLADTDYDALITHRSDTDYIARITQLAHTLLSQSARQQTVIVTGILCQTASGDIQMGNLAVSEQDTYYAQAPYTGKSFSGTGDLFSSVIIGCLVKGESMSQAIDKAMQFLQPAIEEATKENLEQNHGVLFEKYLPLLLS